MSYALRPFLREANLYSMKNDSLKWPLVMIRYTC